MGELISHKLYFHYVFKSFNSNQKMYIVSYLFTKRAIYTWFLQMLREEDVISLCYCFFIDHHN